MGTIDPFDIRSIFENPQVIDSFVDRYNHKNPAHTMSSQDRATLKADPALAQAVFDVGGINSLIAARATTVSELKGKSPELLNFLHHEETAGLVKDNVATVEQLAKLPADKLKRAESLIMRGDSLAAAKTMGFDADQTKALAESVANTKSRILEELQDLLPSLPNANPSPQPHYDPFNKQKPVIKI